MSAGVSPSNAAADCGLSGVSRLHGRRLHPGNAAGLEGHTHPSGKEVQCVGIPVATQNPRRAERRMSGKRKLAGGSEYPTLRLVGAFIDDERRLRKVRLQSDGLHCRGIEVTGPAHHRQLVAGQRDALQRRRRSCSPGPGPCSRAVHSSHFPPIRRHGHWARGSYHHRVSTTVRLDDRFETDIPPPTAASEGARSIGARLPTAPKPPGPGRPARPDSCESKTRARSAAHRGRVAGRRRSRTPADALPCRAGIPVSAAASVQINLNPTVTSRCRRRQGACRLCCKVRLLG